MWAINTNKCLPQELTVKSADNILHRTGLPLISTNSYHKRNLFYNPIIIFIFLVFYVIKEFIILSLDEENDLIFKMLGSWGHFIGIRRQIAFMFVITALLPLLIQLIYYNNYRNGIKPTFLRVFQMMSGLVSPKSLGLTDEQQIRRLLKSTKTSLKYVKINNNIILPIMAFNIMITFYSFNTNLLETLCLGIPNSIIYAICAVYVFNLLIYQVSVFYFLCSYLKMKINSLNERLLEMQRRKRFIRIRETLQSFDSLYSEINEYNTTFWSKVLFLFWNLLGIKVSFIIFFCILSKAHLFNKLLLLYFGFIWIIVFSMIIFTARETTSP